MQETDGSSRSVKSSKIEADLLISKSCGVATSGELVPRFGGLLPASCGPKSSMFEL